MCTVIAFFSAECFGRRKLPKNNFFFSFLYSIVNRGGAADVPLLKFFDWSQFDFGAILTTGRGLRDVRFPLIFCQKFLLLHFEPRLLTLNVGEETKMISLKLLSHSVEAKIWKKLCQNLLHWNCFFSQLNRFCWTIVLQIFLLRLSRWNEMRWNEEKRLLTFRRIETNEFWVDSFLASLF